MPVGKLPWLKAFISIYDIIRNYARSLVHGLGRDGCCQSFANYEQAMHDYLTARDKDWVKVVRQPGDSVEVYGPVDDAEDLLFYN